jgi:phosphatidylglycerol lysyltransferase
VEALVACASVRARDGWYLEDLIRRPDAVNGATELLIVSALGRLAEDGASFATIGVAPLPGTDEQIDRRARWIARTLRFGFDRMDSVFHFASLSRFKSKFRPSAWEPRFVAFNPPRPGIGLVWAVVNVLETEQAPADRAAEA